MKILMRLSNFIKYPEHFSTDEIAQHAFNHLEHVMDVKKIDAHPVTMLTGAARHRYDFKKAAEELRFVSGITNPAGIIQIAESWNEQIRSRLDRLINGKNWRGMSRYELNETAGCIHALHDEFNPYAPGALLIHTPDALKTRMPDIKLEDIKETPSDYVVIEVGMKID